MEASPLQVLGSLGLLRYEWWAIDKEWVFAVTSVRRASHPNLPSRSISWSILDILDQNMDLIIRFG